MEYLEYLRANQAKLEELKTQIEGVKLDIEDNKRGAIDEVNHMDEDELVSLYNELNEHYEIKDFDELVEIASKADYENENLYMIEKELGL